MGKRVRLLMSAALMAVTLPATAEQAWIASPRSADYAWQSTSQWMAKHAGFKARAAIGEIDLLLLGDSLTESWSTAEDIWQQHFACMPSANFGISGDTTQNLLWRITHGEIDGLSPKAVTLLIGTNNLGLNHDVPEDVARGIRTLLDTLDARLPHSRILVFGILPRERDGKAEFAQAIEAINADMAQHAKALGMQYIDLASALSDGHGRPLPGLTVDGLHLSRKGYAIWAEAIEKAIRDLLPHAC